MSTSRAQALIRPLLRFVLTLFLASLIIFALMRAVPGNPARVALGVNATDDAIAERARNSAWTGRCSHSMSSG